MVSFNTNLNMNEIESRIIILKRKAAEADKLREERDMLLRRLNLYRDPGQEGARMEETGMEVMKKEVALVLSPMQPKGSLPADRQHMYLVKKNEELEEKIRQLTTELTSLNITVRDKSKVEAENEALKEKAQRFVEIEKQKEDLIEQNEALREELAALSEVINSNDPQFIFKAQMQRLCTKINNLYKEKENLEKKLICKDNKIFILSGKLSQLEEKLRDPIGGNAAFKKKLGLRMNQNELLALAISDMQNANITMTKELSTLSDRFNILNRRYIQLKNEKIVEMTAKYYTDPIMESYDAEKCERKRKIQEELRANCLGSTCPGSPISLTLTDHVEANKADLAIVVLGVNAAEVAKYHCKLLEVKEEVAMEDMRQYAEELPRFFSLVIGQPTVYKSVFRAND